MISHLTLAVDEPSQIGAARRAAAGLASTLQFDATAAGRVALIATELGTNLSRHAERGRILLAGRDLGAQRVVEFVSIDHGPGMSDIEGCMRDGYSSAGTAGNGLGAIRRLADDFSAFSVVGRGTVIVARVVVPVAAATRPPAAPPRFDVGAICLAAPGESVSGDGWSFRHDANGAELIVVDGLGHGAAAAEATAAALKVFEAGGDRGPSRIIERAHVALRSTRGAAVAIARLHADAVDFAGAGNVMGRLITGVEDRSLLSQPGTVGLQIRHLQDVRYPWPEHAILVLHSDGLVSRWKLTDTAALLRCDPLVIAAWLMRDHHRGRDDATVVVVRRR